MSYPKALAVGAIWASVAATAFSAGPVIAFMVGFFALLATEAVAG